MEYLVNTMHNDISFFVLASFHEWLCEREREREREREERRDRDSFVF